MGCTLVYCSCCHSVCASSLKSLSTPSHSCVNTITAGMELCCSYRFGTKKRACVYVRVAPVHASRAWHAHASMLHAHIHVHRTRSFFNMRAKQSASSRLATLVIHAVLLILSMHLEFQCVPVQKLARAIEHCTGGSAVHWGTSCRERVRRFGRVCSGVTATSNVAANMKMAKERR